MYKIVNENENYVLLKSKDCCETKMCEREELKKATCFENAFLMGDGNLQIVAFDWCR